MKKLTFSIFMSFTMLNVIAQKVYSVDYANEADVKVFFVKCKN